MAGQTSGTTWEIDGKGVHIDGDAFIIVECRRYTDSRPNQEALAGLAYRIHDTGAKGGIIVTPLGIQDGAEKVARAENIVTVRANPSSTTSDYMLRFLDKVIIGASQELSTTAGMAVSGEHLRRCQACGSQFSVNSTELVCPKCAAGDGGG